MSNWVPNICACEVAKRWPATPTLAASILVELERQKIIKSEWTTKHGVHERMWTPV